jgi:hypothetical protein
MSDLHIRLVCQPSAAEIYLGVFQTIADHFGKQMPELFTYKNAIPMMTYQEITFRYSQLDHGPIGGPVL